MAKALNSILTLMVILSALSVVTSCASPDSQQRREQLILNMLTSRLRGVEENNLNFNEWLLRDRNRFFEWIKEPQARLRAGRAPRKDDLNNMISTYASWASMAQENGKWMESQMDGLSDESDEAARMTWSDTANAAQSKDLIAKARSMIENLGEIVRLRNDLAIESRAEAKKLISYRKTVVR